MYLKHITNGIVFIQHYFQYNIDVHILKIRSRIMNNKN